MPKPKINFDDFAFSRWADGNNEQLEQPLPPNIFLALMGFTGLVFIIVLGRIIFLNITSGDFYRARAETNVNKKIILPANRGLIVDKFGEPLVRNTPTFSVTANIADFFKRPVEAKADLQKVSEIINKPISELENILQKADLEKSTEIILEHDISLQQAIVLKTLQSEIISVKDDFKRQYIDGAVFSHILGFVGVSDRGSSIVGKTGLEAFYDEHLRGVDGKYVIYRDAHGEILEEKLTQKSRGGYQLNTTIDADFQRYFYQRFQQGLEQLGRNSGAGLAINPKTGEVLALLSFPSFDNNNPAGYLASAGQPMFNRVVSGVYSPGSVIKPFIAIAALHEGVIRPTDSFFSNGYIEIANPFFPDKPSRFLDWKAHGYVDLYSALARSSNVYFYIVGGGYQKTAGLGISRLLDYWDKFNLGKAIGIDLPAEKAGFFFSPEEKEKKLGEAWRIGDTYNVSIGQGNMAITPVRLLASFAGLAMDGKVPKPFIASSVTDDRNNIALINQPETALDLSGFEPEIHEVKKGLVDAVQQSYGTAHALNDLLVDVAGKTGSAQIANNARTNAFFIGYAPAVDPEIAILILVENAKEGSINTLPIAYDVLNWYYWNRLIKH